MNIQREKDYYYIIIYYAIYDQYYGSAGSNNIYFWSEKKVDLKQKYLYTWSFICESLSIFNIGLNGLLLQNKKKDK